MTICYFDQLVCGSINVASHDFHCILHTVASNARVLKILSQCVQFSFSECFHSTIFWHTETIGINRQLHFDFYLSSVTCMNEEEEQHWHAHCTHAQRICFVLHLVGKVGGLFFWVCFCIAVYLYFCFGWVHEHTHTQNKNAAQFHCIRFLLLFALMCNTHRNFPFRRIKFRFCNSILFYSIGNFGTNTHSIFQQFIYAITWDDVLVVVEAATAAAAVTRICVSELSLVWNISLLLADYVVLILCVFTLC